MLSLMRASFTACLGALGVLSCLALLVLDSSLAFGQSAEAPVAEGDPIAEVLESDGAVAAIGVAAPRTQTAYITLSTGRLVLIRGRRLVVTQEPAPAAIVEEPPPPAQPEVVERAEARAEDAIWVEGHWRPDDEGFFWVEGAYVEPKSAHAFVPPRWVVVEERYLFFRGFYVPYGVFVRSFFNTYHYSGDPKSPNASSTKDRGPYWPVGVSGRPVGVSTTRSRGPYWPLGLGPPKVFSRPAQPPVGLSPARP